MTFRPASAEDQAFINDMNMVATFGVRKPESDYAPTDAFLDSHPEVAAFSHGFGRAGDLGLIALDGEQRCIGAIWGREYDRDGDLVMADHTFEITVGIRDRARRQGIGRRLLDQFAVMARTEGHTELSLGVHVKSPARKLYEAAGYTPIVDSEGNEQILPGNYTAMSLRLDTESAASSEQ